MTKSSYSTYEVRKRAVNAVINGRMSVAGVAKAYGAHRATVHRWMDRHRSEGDSGLLRKQVSGRPRKSYIGDGKEIDWRSIVVRPASDFGFETDFWTCRRLRQVIVSDHGLNVSLPTVWRRLREAELTYQKPERRYFEVNEAERKKWVRNELPKIRAAVKKHRAVLYFEDEASISLGAVLGKTWAPRGETPKQTVTGKRGGISAMSAIGAAGRLLFRLHNRRIASREVIEFLKQILRHHEGRHVVVVMDQAPPHTSKKTQAFIAAQPKLHVFYLPPYSPDWNPDEKVWNHLKNNELKGHQARNKEEMTQIARRKLFSMQKNPSQLRGIFFRCCVAELL